MTWSVRLRDAATPFGSRSALDAAPGEQVSTREPSVEPTRPIRSGPTGRIARALARAIGREQPAAEGAVVAIASGKGGTGKSFLATNLAVAAAQQAPTTLVDCDFGLACDHLLLGVQPDRTLQHALVGGVDIESVRRATDYGPRLVPGGSGVRRLAQLSEAELLRLGDGIATLANGPETVLLDVGAGISAPQMVLLLAADVVVLVTVPEIVALTDAYALVKCLAADPQFGGRVGVVVNRVPQVGAGRATFERLAEVSERFVGVTLDYLGEVPEDAAVTQRRLGRPPLVIGDPRCGTTQAIRDALDAILANAAAAMRDPRRRPVAERFRSVLGRG